MPMNPRLLRPRQTTHPEAAGWATRVRANGGSVSGATLSAVDRFCKAIDAASLRDRFYRLNLFAGTGLNACLVPLYRGPSLGGTQYGDTIDTNNGPFVAGDYAETGASGGLVGNGSSKYLNTGLAPSALPSIATGHLSVYAITGFSGSTIYGLVSSLGSGFAENYTIEANRSTAGLYGAWGKGGSFASLATSAQGAGNGHTIVSRTSSTALTAYRSGNLLRTDSASVTPSSSAANWYIFGHNANGTSVLNYAAARLGGYSIGASLDDAQAAAYYTAMQAFQTALQRNV